MRKQRLKSRHARRSPVFLLSLAVVWGSALLPSLALVAGPTTPAGLATVNNDIGTVTSLASGIDGVVNGVKDTIDILNWLGALHEVHDDDIVAEIKLIAAYQDQAAKLGDIAASDSPRSTAWDDINQIKDALTNGTFDPTGNNGAALLSDMEGKSDDAIGLALAPEGLCTDLPIFQVISTVKGLVSNYDWRMGMAQAMRTVSTRLAALAVATIYDPGPLPEPPLRQTS